MNAFTVCVDYHDIFRQVAPLMRHHFDRWYVVTDHKFAKETAAAVNDLDIEVYVTDAFYRDGAIFNKFLALEELLDIGGRKGWICICDADIVWPKTAPLELKLGKLYTPARYMYPEVNRIPPESEWPLYPIHRNLGEHAGYTQIFHADDPVLGPAPWHQINWTTAGGPDSFFQKEWKKEDKVRPSWYCLHVGPCGTNWAGRASAYADGTVPPDADDKTGMIKKFMRLRGTVKEDRFHHEKLR